VVSNISEESGSNTDVDVDAARKYHVLMELGRGGTAVVSAGIARGIGGFTKLVVLKNIKEEFLSDRDTVRMFINEARLSARMNHPNVVQVYEVFRQNRLPVIVMEYLDGQSLARIQPRAFEDPTYTTPMALGILCKVLSGLQYAHALADYDGTPLELVHRDVSPHNVMLTYDGQVKLVDFGIAKLSASTQNTKTGVVKGKIAYMAPEQLEGGGLDHRGDLFAVGVMLWEAIARRRMWGARSDAEIVRGLVLDDVPSIRAAVPDVDPELAAICDKALAVVPDARYASAAQFQAELELYLAKRAIVVRQQDIADLVTRTCADLRDNSAELLKAELAKFAAGAPGWEDALQAFDDMRTPVPQRERRSKWWLLAVSAIIAFGTAAIVYGWVLQREQSAQARAAEQPPPSAPSPVQEAPAQVTLRVTVTPRQAVVSLDGRLLASSPLTLTLPKDNVVHELRAEADGYEPLTRRIGLASDLELQLELSPLPAPKPPEPVVQPPVAAPASTVKRRPPARPAPNRPAPPVRPDPSAAEKPKPAGVNCNPPYFIGPDGLKHYRRECL
jgi:eukaryotic-like serine/threonine-protein kinase